MKIYFSNLIYYETYILFSLYFFNNNDKLNILKNLINKPFKFFICF